MPERAFFISWATSVCGTGTTPIRAASKHKPNHVALVADRFRIGAIHVPLCLTYARYPVNSYALCDAHGATVRHNGAHQSKLLPFLSPL